LSVDSGSPRDTGDPTSTAVRDRRAREHLANERTLLAWTRTSLTLVALGFVVARFGLFVRELSGQGLGHDTATALGIVLIAGGLVAGAAGLVRFLRVRQQIDRDDFRAEVWAEMLLVGMTAAMAVALAIYLAVTG
jgi:putative membrane protein